MGKLILIRHGQTEMNAQNLYFGKLNPPLNDLGIEQAYMAKEKLSNIAYDCIYSSPLERTRETAEICNYLDKDIIFDSNLEEINFGIFEGLTFKEISEKYQKQTEATYSASRLWVDAIIDPIDTRKWISMGINAANHSPITERFNLGVIQV